jgi:integrase/recombinase XerC
MPMRSGCETPEHHFLCPNDNTKAPAARRLDVARAIQFDVYEIVLRVMDEQDRECLTDRRHHLRDRFILVCLRETGLHATELVGAKRYWFY